MSNFFEFNADANARQSMLEEHLQRSGKKSVSAGRQTDDREPADEESTTKRTSEDPPSVVTDRDRPVMTPVFDELHQALEALRRQPAQLRRIAQQRLAAARRWCDAGQFKRALHELKALAADLAGDRPKPVESSQSQGHWMSEEVVISFGAA